MEGSACHSDPPPTMHMLAAVTIPDHILRQHKAQKCCLLKTRTIVGMFPSLFWGNKLQLDTRVPEAIPKLANLMFLITISSQKITGQVDYVRYQQLLRV